MLNLAFRPLALLICVSLTLCLGACGGGGSAASTPAGLSYQNPLLSTYSVTIAPEVPTMAGSLTNFSVTPALPMGLTLNATTGVISGAPLEAPVTAAIYTISASSAGGSMSFALTVSVSYPPAPIGLSYEGPLHAVVGSPIQAQSPTVLGVVLTYTVLPPLPAGLALDPTSGVLSGTPSASRPDTNYTITGESFGRLASYVLELTVDPAPAGKVLTGVFRDSTVTGLGYRSGAQVGVTDATGTYSYEEGQSLTFFVGAVSLGTIATPSTLASPLDLVPGSTGSATAVINLTRFLMMLDHDGDPTNGIQISPAITAAAASWPAIDFTTTDLPTALAGIITQVNGIDGVVHTLPDAATAQAHVGATLACAYSGIFAGLYSTEEFPFVWPIPAGSMQPYFLAIEADGSVDSFASGENPAFDTINSFFSKPGDFNPLLGLSIRVQTYNGSGFSNSDFLTGDSSSFWAARISGSPGAVYRYSGILNDQFDEQVQGLVALDVDAANHWSGTVLSFSGLLTAVSGGVSGNQVVVSGGGTTYSGPFDPVALTIGKVDGVSNTEIFAQGCRLN